MEQYAVVICGGQSNRMGSDKALVEYNGEPMLIHHVRAFLERGWDVVVTGVDREKRVLLEGMRVVTVAIEEEHGKSGPVRGILQGLEVIPDNEWVQLSPCDAPHLIETILDLPVEMRGGSVRMPVWEEGGEWYSEPLWASGPKDMMLQAILKQKGPLHRRFKEASCVELTIALPHPNISSLNTREELEIVEKTLFKGGGDQSIHQET